MRTLGLLLLLLSLASAAGAQTLPKLDQDALFFPGGEHARAYRTASDRARELEKQGKHAEALTEWAIAHDEVRRAVVDKEWGAHQLFTGIRNTKPIEIPMGLERIDQVAKNAADAAFWARMPREAVKWADACEEIELVEKFEARARADGDEESADVYASRLKLGDAESLERDLAAVERRRRRVLESYFGALGFALGLTFLGAWFRRSKRRKPYTYRNRPFIVRAPHPVEVRSPISWVGVLFVGAAIASIIHGCDSTASQRATFYGILGSVLAVTGAYLIAVRATGNGWFHDERPLAEISSFVHPSKVPELLALFEANAEELRDDFSEAAGLPELEFGGDLGTAIMLYLGQTMDAPQAWDEQIVKTANSEALAWEPLITRYIRRLPEARRSRMLEDLGELSDLYDPPHDPEVVLRWLDQSLVTGRRWSPDEWRELFDGGTLADFCEGVVWGAFQREVLLVAFVLSPEGDYVDVSLDPVDVAGLGDVEFGLVHPGELPSVSAWAEVLADFELHASFDQLDRPDFPDSSSMPIRLNWVFDDLSNLAAELTGHPYSPLPLRHPIHPFGVTVIVQVVDDHIEVRFVDGYIVSKTEVPHTDVSTIARREVYRRLRRARGLDGVE